MIELLNNLNALDYSDYCSIYMIGFSEKKIQEDYFLFYIFYKEVYFCNAKYDEIAENIKIGSCDCLEIIFLK